MKTWKHGIIGLLAIIALVLAFTACDDGNGNKEQTEPENPQHNPNTPMFADKTVTITTNDKFTDKQWNAVVAAIVNKFSTEYNEATNPNVKPIFEGVFGTGIYGVTIIVEKNPQGYTNYKVVAPPTLTSDSVRTLYVRANGVDNINTLRVISVFTGYDETWVDSNPTPTADDFDISGTGTFTYDGNPKTVTITAKAGKTDGSIRHINYRNSSNNFVSAPTEVGTYTASFAVYSTDSWNAAYNLPAGTITIVGE